MSNHDDQQPVPVILEPGSFTVADSVEMLPTSAVGAKGEPRPAMVFVFSLNGQRFKPMIVVAKESEDFRVLAGIVSDIAEAIVVHHNEASVAFLEQLQAKENDVRDGSIDCPICGRTIYGDVARRGACLACMPELPNDSHEDFFIHNKVEEVDNGEN